MVGEIGNQSVIGPDSGSLSFENTVYRELVHRRSVHEVLVTDSARVEDERFLIAAQLGRGNGLFGDRRSTYHDPLMAMEAARQGTVLVAHQYWDVPRDWKFVANRMSSWITSLEAFRDRGRPADVLIDMRVVNPRFSADQLSGMGFELHVVVDGASAATMNGALTCLSKEDYAKLREYVGAHKSGSRHPTTRNRLPPSRVGRYHERNVVIGDVGGSESSGQQRYGVVVDECHPTLFDHQLDHVPGIYSLEAMRQAAVASAAPASGLSAGCLAVLGCAANFEGFAELDTGLECVVSTVERAAEEQWVAEVGLRQGTDRLAEAEVILSGTGPVR